MVVILVISVGIVGVMNLISSIFIQTKLISSKLVASYLAQEGIEIVRNIRDGNWLESGANWDDDIFCCACETPPCGCDCEADYSSQTITQSFSGGGNFLNIDGSGFYGYSGSNSTKFKRQISLSLENAYEILVTVIITWDSHEVKVMEKLYDWK